MVKKIHITNFKGITDLEILCDGHFNVLIGENNIGKTTIFEAIHLWKMCYDLHIKKDKNGFYASGNKNLLFKDMSSIRVYEDMDLFPVGCDKSHATTVITLEIEYLDQSFSLGFSVGKVTNLDNAYYQTNYVNLAEFKKFSDMVDGISGKNLANFLVINESRPIANLIAKEPYMYKAQVLEKIAKGKGNEVLRNKIIENKEIVQEHLNNVLDGDFKITVPDREKTYIALKVNGKDIFSYGSGFLQVAEIFSSIVFTDSEIHLLLIDEPDAHLHVKMQKRLLQELKGLDQCQTFVISHNERFLNEVEENEILFIDERAKQTGKVEKIPSGFKGVVVENLVGCLERADQLSCARKLIFVEGKGDRDFLNTMMPLYENYTGKEYPCKQIVVMDGIDTLNGKLISYSRALKGVVPPECQWLLIRDTDCVPISKKITAKNDDIANVDTGGNPFNVCFQNGYGIESTFIAEPNRLAEMLCDYYELEDSAKSVIESILLLINQQFSNDVRNVTNPLFQKLEKHYNRQMEKRSGRVYKDLKIGDMLREIDENNVQYIMTKEIMDNYLSKVHIDIKNQYPSITKPALDRTTIFDFYYSWISCEANILESHRQLLDEIYR